MKRVLLVAVLATLSLLWFSLQPPVSKTFHGEDGIEGAYEFVEIETPDGPQATQQGMLVANDGYLCHLRTAKDREKLSRDDSEEDRQRKAAAAFRGANGVCGSYSIEGDHVKVVWSTAVNPNSEGNSTEFIFKQADGLLKISPAQAPQFAFVYRRK